MENFIYDSDNYASYYDSGDCACCHCDCAGYVYAMNYCFLMFFGNRNFDNSEHK